MALLFIGHSTIKAQVGISINIGLQPLWGPVENDYVEYYYLPEYDIYYYAPDAKFIYWNNSEWTFALTLPYQYRHVNLYSTYKVVINEHRPYLRNSYYAAHYKDYKHSHKQQKAIRDSRDPKYQDVIRRHDNSNQNNGFRQRNDKYPPIEKRGNEGSRRRNKGDKK